MAILAEHDAQRQGDMEARIRGRKDNPIVDMGEGLWCRLSNISL